MPFSGGHSGEVLWADLPEVFLDDALQPLHFVPHTPVGPLKGVEPSVNGFYPLFI